MTPGLSFVTRLSNLGHVEQKDGTAKLTTTLSANYHMTALPSFCFYTYMTASVRTAEGLAEDLAQL
jgi:hypothetical protein